MAAINVIDYKEKLDGADAFLDNFDEVGLKFALVYEYRTAEVVINNTTANSVVEAA